MPYLIHGAALWLLTLATLVVHGGDILRRMRRGQMPLESYRQIRPVEWGLAGVVLCGAAAAALDGMAFWELRSSGGDLAEGFNLLVALAIMAVVLCFIGVHGINRVAFRREDTLNRPGGTFVEREQVLVNLELEARHDAAEMRRVGWYFYLIDSVPLIVAARYARGIPPQSFPIAVVMVLLGAVVLFLLLSTLPSAEPDEDAW